MVDVVGSVGIGSCTRHLHALLIEPRWPTAVAVCLNAAMWKRHTPVTRVMIAYSHRGGAKYQTAGIDNTVAGGAVW